VRLAAAAALLLAVVVATAPAAARRTVLNPAPVAALAADDAYVAFASSHAARDCDRIRVWNRASGRVVRIGRTTSCEQTSTGSGLGGLSIAGRRVLWLFYAGGNTRDYEIFTATTTAPRPRRVAFGSADVDFPSPFVVGPGDASRFGDLLPFAVSRDVFAVTASGRRAFQWRAARTVTAVGARAGSLAVALADGGVVAFDGTADAMPDVQWTGSPAASAVFVTGDGVAAQRGNRVELRTGSGTLFNAPLPSGARVTDASGSQAVFVRRGTIYSMDVPTGTVRRLVRGTAAQLAPGLVYANGRRVTALPTAP
jgi:hypothetical protein